MSDDSILRAGDPWDAHYRGSRYHCSSEGVLWWALPSGLGRIRAISGFEDVVALFLAIRPEGGSFRITEAGAVLTRDPTSMQPIYVGEYVGSMEFEHVDVLGEGIEPLDLWPAFYDGARYSYKAGRLWWKNADDLVWQEVREPLPEELLSAFHRVKPSGGSLRITENGKVLALIAPQPLPKHLKPQYERLTDAQKRLIAIKTARTDLLPVLVGEFYGDLTLLPPRRLTDPMSADEEADLVGFLMRYDTSMRKEAPQPLDFHEEVEDLIDRGGPA